MTSRFEIRSVLIHDSRVPRVTALGLSHDIPIYAATAALMESIAGFPVHRGVLALAERGPSPDWQELNARPGPCLILEDVGDPDNIGALFRTAAAFGYGSVLCSPATADPLYRKAIRSSMGWTLHVPFATLEPWPAALNELAAAGRTIVGLTPIDGDDVAEVAADVHESRQSLAVLVGAEGPGLSAASMAQTHRLARIPMAEGVDSINVAMAAAIALYEFARAR